MYLVDVLFHVAKNSKLKGVLPTRNRSGMSSYDMTWRIQLAGS